MLAWLLAAVLLLLGQPHDLRPLLVADLSARLPPRLVAATPAPTAELVGLDPPAATPAAAANKAPAAPAAVAAIVCRPEFTWSCQEALDLTWCESRWVEGIDTNPPYVGWWQVSGGSYDSYQNTLQAHVKYVAWKRGTVADPWPGCP